MDRKTMVAFFPTGMLTPKEKELLKANSIAADKRIRFVDFEAVQSEIKRHKTYLIFFGANWCSNTQRYMRF
jgi:hypothetical protein